VDAVDDHQRLRVRPGDVPAIAKELRV